MSRPSSPDSSKETRKFTEVALNEEFVIQAPDGGWGWTVVLASLMSNFLVDGVMFNAGQVFQPIWQDYFHTSVSVTAWVVSILIAFYYLAGPFTGCLINVLGCRSVSLIGAILLATGFTLSLFATSIFYLYFTFGLISGVGMGMVYLSSVIVVNYYFEKKRALATGIAVCGSGFGAMTFGPLMIFLNDCFGWRGCLLIIVGVLLNCIACSMIYLPLKPSKTQIEKFEETVKQELHKEQVASKKQIDPIRLSAVPEEVESEPSVQNGTCTAEMVASAPLAESPAPFSRPVFNRLISETVQLEDGTVTRVRKCSLSQDVLLRELSTEGNLRKLSVDSIMKINSPLNRKDIFYRSSSRTLERQLSSQATTSVVLPELEEEEPFALTPKLAEILKVLKNTFHGMLDVKLLMNINYITWAVQGAFFYFASMIPFIYLPRMAVELGHSAAHSALLISIIGAINIVCRLLFGWLSDKPNIDAQNLQNFAILVGGLATLLLPVVTSYWSMVLYCCLFGAGLAAFAVLRSVVAVQLFGLEKLTNAMGISLLFLGISGLLGSPIAGFLYDISGSYHLSFYMAGVTMTIAALDGFMLEAISKRQAKRRRRKLTPYPNSVQCTKL